MKIPTFSALAVLTLLAGCSGANGGAITPTTPNANGNKSTAILKITIPTPPPGATVSVSTRVRPAYVSYRVQSVVISGTGVNAPNNSVTANVMPSSPGCSGTPTTCSVPIATNVGSSESFTITAYSSTNGTGTVLSSGTVTMAVVAGAPNTIAVPLNPIVNFGPIAPPSNPSAVEHVTQGPDGAIYMMADHLYVFSPTAQAVSSCEAAIGFNTPIVAGTDGNIWVADQAGNIDKVQISGSTCGALTPYAIGSSQVTALTVGSDGKIWFGTGTNEIGTITTSGTVTNVTTSDNAPNQMILGGDGSVWFSTNAGEIEKVTTSGVVTVVATGVNPFSIALGSDGNVWYSTSSTIGKITPGGTATTYSQAVSVLGQGLALGPDGQLWFLNSLGIAEITTGGSVTTYTGWGGFAYSGSLAFGADGNLYFGASADLDEFVR